MPVAGGLGRDDRGDGAEHAGDRSQRRRRRRADEPAFAGATLNEVSAIAAAATAAMARFLIVNISFSPSGTTSLR